jgi:hypothetical protein
MVKTDPSLSFVTLMKTNQTLRVEPTTAFLGSFQLYLISSTTQDPPIMLVQQVTIKVYPTNGSQSPDVDATISAISNAGLVSIDFNQKMNIPINATDKISG